MANENEYSKIISKALGWGEAHADFKSAVTGLSADFRGKRPPGMPHSPWEILEHIRISQHDILDFCRNPKYEEMKWPDDYWPRTPAPPDAKAWDASVAAFYRDLDDLRKLAEDPAIDLLATIPHGSGQTYLRELLLTIDHNAYHVGQLITVRQMLGAWK